VTLLTGPGAISVEDEIYAYSQRVDFSAYASGAEAIALDFTSPNDHYSCLINVSLDVGCDTTPKYTLQGHSSTV